MSTAEQRSPARVMDLLQEQVTDFAIITMDRRRRVLSWNRGAELIFGWSSQEMNGQSADILFFTDEQDAGDAVREQQRAERDGRADDTRWHAAKGGRKVFCNGSMTALRDDHGNVVALAKIVRDQTARHQEQQEQHAREEALRHQLALEQARLTAVLNQMPAGVAIAEAPTGRLLFHNAEALRLLGHEMRTGPDASVYREYGAEHADGTPYRPEEYPIWRAVRGEVVNDEHMLYRRGDNAMTEFSVSARPVRNEAGAIVAAVSTFHDVADERRAERALARSEARFRFLSELGEATRDLTDPRQLLSVVTRRLGEHMRVCRCAYAEVEADGDAFTIVDDYTNGCVSSAGSYKLTMFGSLAAAAQRGGKTLVIHDINRELPAGDGRDAFAAIDVQAVICCPLVKAGRLTAMMAVHQASPRRWTDDEVKLVEEVVERSWAYVERGRAHRELAASAAQFQQLAEERKLLLRREREARSEVERANRAKDEFMAVLSHELRNPMAPIVASCDLLLADAALNEDTRAEIVTIRRNAQLEARLIDDLLDVTRIVRGRLHLVMQPVSLDALITQVIEICRPDIGARNLRLTLNLAAAETCVEGDPARLQQILWNLVKNAVKFSRAGEVVEIETANPDPQTLEVRIRDSGVGIAPEDLSRIFRPFEQAEAGRRVGGLGLGLSISHGLAELHHGSLRAESDGPGRGSTFVLTLPTLRSARCLAEPVARPAPTSADRRLRVLLAEDYPDTARTMARLIQLLGHTVSIAPDVPTALELASRESFDLVISDIGLGEQSGLDLMRALRDKFPRLPGVALSGYGMEADVQRSRDAGFSHHLIKPVDLQALDRVLGEVGDVT